MRVELKNILCATDFSEHSNQTVECGIVLAKEFDARLFVCHVVDLTPNAFYGEAPISLIEHQQRIIDNARERIAAFIGSIGVEWEPLVTIGRASDEIARMAVEKKADLVISATRGRTGLKRLVLGSVTGRLMRTLSCPLLIVRDPDQNLAASIKEKGWFRRILVGCDFSKDSILAFNYALSLAQEFLSELHLVHVVEPSVYNNWLKTPPAIDQEFQKDLNDRLAEKLIDNVPEEALNWCTPKTVVLEGEPHDEITRYAEEKDIDLIVLGIRGQGLVESLLVGSTTDRVARRAPCPVLSVCPKE